MGKDFKKKKWNPNNARQFDRRQNGGEERVQGGSFPIEEIKGSETWEKRVEFQSGPKRNWALCFGYIGSEYQGLQMNPDCNSVERHLEKALLLAGGIQEVNFGNLNRIHWNRAARTDKGVHANAQCIAAKLSVHQGDEGNDEERRQARRAFVEKVNEFLPSDMCLHHITKVTKKFNAKNFCGSRKYHYLVPSYACLPKETMKQHLDSVGGNIEELKALEAMKGYRMGTERRTELEGVLGCFEGTFKFHNFTSGKLSSDGDASRYIKKFNVLEVVVDEQSGVEWLLIEIHGQSFLYNQIRKMVAAVLQVVRGVLTVEDLHANYLKTDARNPTMPIAPGVGLYLHEMEYNGYNKKVGMLNSGDDARMPAPKKQRVEEGSSGAKDEEEEGGAAREVLDMSCSSEGMKRFQQQIWKHVMAEEERENHFLHYLVGTDKAFSAPAPAPASGPAEPEVEPEKAP